MKRGEDIGPTLKYPGAKWRLASWIISHLPPYDLFRTFFREWSSIFLEGSIEG